LTGILLLLVNGKVLFSIVSVVDNMSLFAAGVRVFMLRVVCFASNCDICVQLQSCSVKLFSCQCFKCFKQFASNKTVVYSIIRLSDFAQRCQ